MTTEINPKDDRSFRMQIEQIYSLDNIGLMIVGPTQREGTLKEGDTIAIVGSKRTIQTHVDGIDIRYDSMGLRLTDVGKDEVEVGMYVTTAGV